MKESIRQKEERTISEKMQEELEPIDSKYTKTRMRHRFKSDPALGEMECYICSTTFTKSGRFDRFCYECKRTGRVV